MSVYDKIKVIYIKVFRRRVHRLGRPVQHHSIKLLSLLHHHSNTTNINICTHLISFSSDSYVVASFYCSFVNNHGFQLIDPRSCRFMRITILIGCITLTSSDCRRFRWGFSIFPSTGRHEIVLTVGPKYLDCSIFPLF